MRSAMINATEMLRGKSALVTGAGRLQGIGAAICRHLAQAGADIFFTYWQPYDKAMSGADASEPESLKQELRSLGVKVASLEVDLSEAQAVTQVLDAAEAALGPLTILINNAAYSVRDGYEGLNAGILDATYAINLRATALLSVEFACRYSGHYSEHSLGRSGGRIINLTSGQFQGPMVGEIAYTATKGAVDALTITLAAEVAANGITVNAINPGPTDTGWMSDRIKQDLLPRFPMRRIGHPSDAAKLVLFLASDDAEWITGQIIHSEGGFCRT